MRRRTPFVPLDTFFFPLANFLPILHQRELILTLETFEEFITVVKIGQCLIICTQYVIFQLILAKAALQPHE